MFDFNEVLKDFQYKPNFAYSAYEREDHWWVKIVMMVEDSRKPFELWQVSEMPQRASMFDDYDVDYYYDFNYRVQLPPPRVVYSPSRAVIEIQGNYPIPYFGPGDELIFIQWMVRTLKEMEMHEVDEWARYKGELLNDPHKERTDGLHNSERQA